MDPARRRAYRLSNVFEKSDDVVVRSLFDFQNLRNRKSRSLSNFRSVLLWNLAKVCHPLTSEYFNLQPDLELPLVRPDFAHLWPGITVDHCVKIKATDLCEKCFVDHANPANHTGCSVRCPQRSGFQRENRTPLRTADSTALRGNRVGPRRLTDAGASETPIVVQPHLAAGKKIRDGRDRLPAAVRAGADRQDEITQRKPGARL